MRRLRIACLSHGSFTHIESYVRFFKSRGHDVHWIVFGRPFKDLGVPTHMVSGGPTSIGAFAKWRYVPGGLRLRSLIREVNPDVLNGHYATSAGTMCLVSGFRPYIVTVHGTDIHVSLKSPVWRWVLRHALGKATRVVAVSRGLGDFVQTVGVQENRILIATPGVDVASLPYLPRTMEQGPLRLLCIRWLDHVYDPLTIVRACETLARQRFPFTLTFAAGGPMESDVRGAVARCGLKDKVTFLRGYQRADLPKLFASHDVYVSASLTDGTAISLLEAMACGIYPVVSRIQANRNWLVDGQTCQMFDSRNAEQLASSLHRVLELGEGRLAAVEANRRVVEELGDTKPNMLRLEQAYLSAVGEYRARREALTTAGVVRKFRRRSPVAARKLRLAFLSAGNFVHVRSYLEYFRDHGHEVHWIAFSPPAQVPGIEIHHVSSGVDPLTGTFAKAQYLLTVPRLRTVLRAVRPDLLHGHYATSAGVLCMMSRYRPYMLSVRGSDLIGSMRSPVWRVLLRQAFAEAVHVHTVSQQLARLAGQLGVSRDKCSVLTQGVDTRALAFRPAEGDGGPVRLLCTRHLRDVYDPMVILEACAILASRNVAFRMVFAGAGPLQPEMEKRARELGLKDRVVFLGGFSNAAVNEMLWQNDIYVSSSRWDGTSVSLLEAMACGIFPVVSKIPSNQAWLVDGETALMFECGNARDVARQLELAISSEGLRRAAVLWNRQLVVERADRATNMALLEALYYGLADSSAPRSRRGGARASV